MSNGNLTGTALRKLCMGALALALAFAAFAVAGAYPSQALAAQAASGQQLGAGTVQPQAKSTSKAVKSAKKTAKLSELAPKMVMIGDSYATKSAKRNVSAPWPERVANSLGISVSNRFIYRSSGFGFAKPGKRFIQLLGKKAHFDDTVTDVLIVGGAGNDRYCSKAQISLWYRITINLISTLYPNAKIMHAITSWDLVNQKYQKLLVEHIPWYKSLAKQCGVTYLAGCEKVIRSHPEYFAADRHHPNDLGQKAIAKSIVKKIRKINSRYASPKLPEKPAAGKKAA